MIEWRITIDANSMVEFADKHRDLNKAILDIIHNVDVVSHSWNRIYSITEQPKIQLSTVYGKMGGADNAK